MNIEYRVHRIEPLKNKNINEYIKNVYGDLLESYLPLKTQNDIVMYEIYKKDLSRKEILKVIPTKNYNSSILSDFKKKIEFINSIFGENDGLLKSSIVKVNEADPYLIISRYKNNKTLEDMNDIELINIFKEIGSYPLLKTLCRVLRVFHENGYYHGGIKLSNIILIKQIKQEKFEFLICDYFYLLLNKNKSIITKENVNYVSPEELTNIELDVKKDMWNIGIILYKILSGKFPFDGNSIETKQKKIFNAQFDDLDIKFKDKINPLIHKLLKKESKNRLSIKEFENVIDKINSNIYIGDSIHFVEKRKEEKGVVFIPDFNHNNISINDNGTTIINTVGGAESHCYLNMEIKDEAIHHFIFKLNRGNNGIFFGCSTNSEYVGDDLSDNETSCSIGFHNYYCYLYGSNGNKMIDDELDNIDIKEGEEYEIIFNMKENTVSIKQRNCDEIILFTDIQKKLYIFASIYKKNDSVSIIKYWKIDYNNMNE